MKTQIVRQEEKDGVSIYHLKRVMSFKEAQDRKATWVTGEDYDLIVDHDADGYDASTGELLFRFRKSAMPMETLKTGIDNYKHSVSLSNQRGDSAGGTKDLGNGNSGSPDVTSGNVGFMDPGARTRYCRTTAFGRNSPELLAMGRPFVEYIDDKYKELCPEHYARQIKTANETNANFVLWDTAFSTITVNKNFRTAIHQDAGDHPEGFGNLFVYREGNWTKGYFCLVEYGVGVDMQNQDMLFVDVHKWHSNAPAEIDGKEVEFKEFPEGNIRYSFVLYYRSGLRTCKQPSVQLAETKQKKSSYLRL